jgi:hypothetical protein
MQWAEFSGQRNHQGERAFCDGFLSVFRNVYYRDVAAAGGLEVDRIDPYAVLNNTPKAAGGLNDALRDWGVTHQQQLGVGYLGYQLLLKYILGQSDEFQPTRSKA